MAPVRRRGFLSCFYCGRRSSIARDSGVRKFACDHCLATNFLDEDGDIADPPAAAVSGAAATQARYATRSPSPQLARHGSPASSSPSRVFCETCVKNQHLFTASLAQYLPDDPDHPDYADRERDYYEFRRRLERRYPQICADCEPRVRDRIAASGYTARADNLRRVLDRSTGAPVKRRNLLDVVDRLGSLCWYGALLLQLIWHLVAVLSQCRNDQALVSGYISSLLALARTNGTVAALLDRPAGLAAWALCASVSCAWWNPRFVQTVRGFTSTVRGLPAWYTYQAALVLARAGFSAFADRQALQSFDLSILASAHGLMLLLTAYIYAKQWHSVKIDYQALFRSPKRPLSEEERHAGKVPSGVDMASVLDDIMSAPVRPDPLLSGYVDEPPDREMPMLHGSQNGRRPRAALLPSRRSPLASSPMTAARSNALVDVPAEMDWSPTVSGSMHRALQPSSRNQTGPVFGQQPEPDSGTFWFKVPPAPMTPARRKYNPPNPLKLRSSIVDKENQLPFGGLDGRAATASELSFARDGQPRSSSDSVFKDAAFSAPPLHTNDPRNSLSDMFGQSFTLKGDEDGSSNRSLHKAPARRLPDSAPGRPRPPPLLGYSEIFTIVTSLFTWVMLHTKDAPQYSPSGLNCKVNFIGLVVTALAVTGKLFIQSLWDVNSSPSLAACATCLLGLVEVGMGGHVAWLVWADGPCSARVASEGSVLFGSLIVHQVANLVF